MALDLVADRVGVVGPVGQDQAVGRQVFEQGLGGPTVGRLTWKAKFGGMEVSEAKRLRALEDENAKLKRMLADAMLDNVALKDLLGKKW